VLALGLGGLPLTGGALAKLAVKAPLGEGLVGLLATLSAIGSTLLMLHFLRCLMLSAPRDSETTAAAGLVIPWLAIALAAVALPWALYPAIANVPLHDTLTPRVLWDALWPILIGGLLAVALRRWRSLVPHIREGDVLTPGMSAARAALGLGAAMERADGYLRQWPVAGVLLVAFTVILAGTMLAGR
jgi:hypothetical protein